MHNETLRGNLHTRRLKLLPVPGDGNCFFHSLIVTLRDCLKRNPGQLISIGYNPDCVNPSTENVTCLRKLLVDEWLGDRREQYEQVVTLKENYEDEATKFLQDVF